MADTSEHDKGRTGDGPGGRLAAGRQDQWVEGSVHDQGRQSQLRESLGPIQGSEHCRLLTEFACGIVCPLKAHRANFVEPVGITRVSVGRGANDLVQLDQLFAGVVAAAVRL